MAFGAAFAGKAIQVSAPVTGLGVGEGHEGDGIHQTREP